MEIKNGFSSLFAVLLILSAALLLAATAAYAQGRATLPPCFNGVQDEGEEGVDCGGRCSSPSFIELCDGKDNDYDCLVDEDCKNWSFSIVNGSAGVSGGGGGKAQGPPPGYVPIKMPQSNGGSTSSASSAVAQPQKAPEQGPPKSIPQDQAASGSPAVPAEEVPGEIPQQVGGAVSGSSAPSASSNVQKAGSSSSDKVKAGNGKAGNVNAKGPQDEKSQQNSQSKPNALVRLARFFKGLFG